MKHLGLALAAATLFSPTASHAAPPAAAFGVPGFASAGTVSQFQVTDKTQVPGHQLKPGSYSITIVDQLNDRMVLRVNNSAGKEEATFIGLPAGSRLPKQGGQGPIAMTAKGSNKALRGFTFADGSVAEFVYPKEEAVALAKVNSTTIPAVDPASEGRVATPNLSRTDMELVTLWMLTPTLVGQTAGIEAKRYDQVAEASTPPPPPAPTPRVRTRTADVTVPAPVTSSAMVAPVAPAPVPHARAVAHPIAALPHTASELPLVGLAGALSVLLASMLSFRRLFGAASR